MLLYVDVIDACHLKCPTCVRGVRAFPNTAKKMSISLFRQIVEKAKRDGAFRVDLFSWTEPFLCQNLDEYLATIKECDLPCGVSSTLSLRNIRCFEAALRHMDELTISMSGFDQDIYGINHKGGNVEWVKANLERLSALKAAGSTCVDATIRMLMFDYNREEEPRLREYAAKLGLRFEVLLASGHPVSRPEQHDNEKYVLDRLKHFSVERPYEERGKVCPLIFEHVVVDADGDVYQCSAYGNYAVLKIGAYLDLTREEVLLRRYMQPVCNSCSWRRRTATEQEKLLLEQALRQRMGQEITDRVPQMSVPSTHTHAWTAEGYLIPKHDR